MRVLIGCETSGIARRAFAELGHEIDSHCQINGIECKQPVGCYQHADRPNRNGSYGDHVMAKRQLPSPEVLRQLLRYEPETGKLFWKERPESMFLTRHSHKSWNTRHAGTEAFTTTGTSGYKEGRIFYALVRAHRVIYAMHNGAWPDHEVDHINGVRTDNRLENLRHASRKENGRNQKRPHDNLSGVIGVGFYKRDGTWQARISTGGRNIHLGYFTSKEDAIRARKSAEQYLGFHENHGRQS
ncbi:HNH endonuclease signature motif containing protein [uncultured Sphingomonas sp.]|uniref:HNH endonuclease signature motif containing protein n=1 Tax=uncultured Sphingomonas sp. TaxID=158754 RepID=UPI0025F71135|nr:HNH endonuclease signature motif containing protein [uncultured Sphingomonas sp.]